MFKILFTNTPSPLFHSPLKGESSLTHLCLSPVRHYATPERWVISDTPVFTPCSSPLHPWKVSTNWHTCVCPLFITTSPLKRELSLTHLCLSPVHHYATPERWVITDTHGSIPCSSQLHPLKVSSHWHACVCPLFTTMSPMRESTDPPVSTPCSSPLHPGKVSNHWHTCVYTFTPKGE